MESLCHVTFFQSTADVCMGGPDPDPDLDLDIWSCIYEHLQAKQIHFNKYISFQTHVFVSTVKR